MMHNSFLDNALDVANNADMDVKSMGILYLMLCDNMGKYAHNWLRGDG